jgi:DNA ligase-1
MKTWPALHKLDNKGKVRFWEVQVGEIRPDVWGYTQYHGTLGGKLVSSTTELSAGKNIGKKNETTVQEQCELKAESLWTKKRDRDGYTEHIPTEKPLRPMLAKKYKEDGKHIKFPCLVQPKLNGLRCLAFVKDGKVKLVSRKNVEWKSLSHLVEELSNFPDGIYDGELYIHGPLFNKIIGAVKRDEANDLSAQIELHIYDIVEENTDYVNRWARIPSGMKFIQQVETVYLTNANSVDTLHDQYVSQGYEGIMLRNRVGGYKVNGRSKDLQKYKKFDDDEFPIIGATENVVGDWVGTCTFRCVTKDGNEFNVMPKGDYDTRAEFWEDWKAGKIKVGDMLTVEYFGFTTTDKPVPNFPVGKEIRSDI